MARKRRPTWACLLPHCPPRGGRQSARARHRPFRLVSIHAPAGGRLATPTRRLPSPAVSIHAPAWGATYVLCKSNGGSCFNPRPRERGDDIGRRIAPGAGVSIHAPARGATSNERLTNPQLQVSIHAPARGATPIPKGRHIHHKVSIHAPARGRGVAICPQPLICFNPRPRVGGDSAHRSMIWDNRLFQSTPPREGRPFAARLRQGFNPRPRVGGDRVPAGPHLRRVSIHAPA